MRRSTNLTAVCAVALTALLFLAACNRLNGVRTDNGISAKTRSEIRKLNDSLMQAMAENKPARVLKLCSEELKQQARANLAEVASLYRSSIANTPVQTFHQYHVRSIRAGALVAIPQSQAGVSDFELRYELPCQEFVMTLFSAPDSTGLVRTMNTVFGKNKAGAWKLYVLYLGTLTVLGQDAIYYYRQAEGMYREGNLIEAARLSEVCEQLLRPAGSCWRYAEEQKIAAFSRELKRSMAGNWKFPFTSEVGGEPVEFLGVTSMIDTGSRLLIPQIAYATKKNIRDTAALSQQCDEIHPYIHLVFPGITRYNKQISYVASDSPSLDSGSYFVMQRRVSDGPPRHSAIIRGEQ